MKAIPYAMLGFAVGAAIGFAWGQTAKNRISESVKTEFAGGVLTVTVDTLDALKTGLPEWLARR